jgi:hypothetical protein
MDRHVNCRCSASPYIGDGSDVEWESGASWLKRQPVALQDTVLGREGGSLFRSGNLLLEDFERVTTSRAWGASVSDGGVQWAKRQAVRRGTTQSTAISQPSTPAFQTHDEAIGWAKANLKTSLDYESFKKPGLDIATDTIRAIAEFEARLGRQIPGTVEFGRLGGDRIGQFDYNSRVMRLRPLKSNDYWDDAASRREAWIEKTGGVPFNIVTDTRSLLWHEAGHAVDAAIQRSGTGYIRGKATRLDFSNLSGYATTKNEEAWAESFAAIATEYRAEHVPPEVAQRIRKFLKLEE